MASKERLDAIRAGRAAVRAAIKEGTSAPDAHRAGQAEVRAATEPPRTYYEKLRDVADR